MSNLEAILLFLIELAGTTHKGVVIFALFLSLCAILILVSSVISYIVNLITSTQKHIRFNKEIGIKRSIYHRFAEMAREAQRKEDYDKALEIMTKCTILLLDMNDSYKEKEFICGDDFDDAETKPSSSRIEEPISGEDGQSSDRASDGSKKSFAEITD